MSLPVDEIMEQIESQENGFFMLCDTSLLDDDLKNKLQDLATLLKPHHRRIIKHLNEIADRLGVQVSLKSFIVYEKHKT
jgi:hypothetical protein